MYAVILEQAALPSKGQAVRERTGDQREINSITSNGGVVSHLGASPTDQVRDRQTIRGQVIEGEQISVTLEINPADCQRMDW